MCAQHAEQALHLDQTRARLALRIAAQEPPKLQHVVGGLAGFPRRLGGKRLVAQSIELAARFLPLGDQALLLSGV